MSFPLAQVASGSEGKGAQDMTIKDLLLQVDGTPAFEQRLEAALALAGAYDAHLTALCLVAEPYIPAIVGVNLPPEVIRQQREAAEAAADAMAEKIRAKAQSAGISVETRRETAMIDRLAAVFARQGRHTDLVIVGQSNPESESDDASLVEAAFMDTGRPALVIPYIGPRNVPPRKILCAWDGSREAARAINDAIPFLMAAKDVSLLIVDPQSLADRIGEQPGADMGAHLARHGVRVTVETAQSGDLSVGDVILSQASDEGTDLLVMGAYGHSRLREMVLGGTTEHMLRHMTVPVLFGH
jgi:nucleotide-binding universal stress UspA family protein